MEYGNDFEIGYSLNEVNFTNDLSDERFSNPEENLKEEENSQLTKNRTISSSAKSKFILDDFDVRKNKVLKDLEEEIDNSPKGSLDEPLIPLINLINKHPNYVTTSSCSGRVGKHYFGKNFYFSDSTNILFLFQKQFFQVKFLKMKILRGKVEEEVGFLYHTISLLFNK